MVKWLRYWLPLFGYCVLIFALSSSSSNSFPSFPVFWNKLSHVVEYSFLGFLMARSLFSLNLRYSKAVVVVLTVSLCALYGLSDEVHQSFTPGRNANISDFVADGFGSVIGAFFYSKTLLIRRFRRLHRFKRKKG